MNLVKIQQINRDQKIKYTVPVFFWISVLLPEWFPYPSAEFWMWCLGVDVVFGGRNFNSMLLSWISGWEGALSKKSKIFRFWALSPQHIPPFEKQSFPRHIPEKTDPIRPY